MAGRTPTDKVTIEPLVTGNPFIKTPDEIASLFGFRTSARSKLKFIGKLVGEEVKLSDRSLDSLSKNGISEKVFLRAFEPLIEKCEEMTGLSLDKPLPDGTRKFDVDILLKSCLKLAIDGIFQSCSEENLQKSTFQPLELFIERRCREFQPQKEWIELYRGNGANLEDATKNLAGFYRPIMNKTMLTNSEIEEVLNIINKIASGEKSFEISSAKPLLHFNHDFDLSFFSALDLFCFNLSQDFTDEKITKNSLLLLILNKNNKCHFGNFISLIKESFDISNSMIANCIPINHANNKSGRTLIESKIERLKEWKKGKSQPSFSTLSQFCKNISSFGSLPLLILALISLSIDRQIAKCKHDFEEIAMREIFSADNYRRYYLKEKEAEV